MENKEKNQWDQHKESAKMIIEYEQELEYCTRFITEQAIPCTEQFEYDSNGTTLINHLLSRYEAMEDYNMCAKLFLLQRGFKFPDEVDSTDLAVFVQNAEAVLHYEKNILICWKEIELLGMIALTPIVKKKEDDIDSLILVEKLIDYFQMKREIEKCEILMRMKQRIDFKRREVSSNPKKNNP